MVNLTIPGSVSAGTSFASAAAEMQAAARTKAVIPRTLRFRFSAAATKSL